MASYDEKLSGLIDKPCLYSTICATRVDAETGEAIEPLYDEAGTYCEVIARQMEAFRTKEYPTDDLMRYFCLPNSPQTETSIKSKIRSAHVTVEAVGKNLYGKLKLDMTADLTSRELEAFTRQIEVQYRDGWGAEFELLDICAGKDCVCLRLWHDEISFFTGQEFELEKQRHTLPHCAFVSEVNKDTFWELLAQAKARCADCQARLDRGERVTAAMRDSGLLPAAPCRLLELAQRSGAGDSAMEKIAASLAEDSESALEERVSRVEPALVLVCSILVGLILLSVMLPLMHIMSAIG